MKRRSLLAGLGGALGGAASATAGCLDVLTGVVGTSVEHVEPRRVRERRRTIVAFDEADGEVRILGFMYYGSSSCDRVGLDAVEYDAGHLEVVVAPTQQNALPVPLPIGCTADMAATWYRATVTFADGLPERVTVVEDGAGEESTTRTVDRADQRELCTTDHPEGSNASRRAHWTCPERYVAVDGSAEGTPEDGA